MAYSATKLSICSATDCSDQVRKSISKGLHGFDFIHKNDFCEIVQKMLDDELKSKDKPIVEVQETKDSIHKERKIVDFNDSDLRLSKMSEMKKLNQVQIANEGAITCVNAEGSQISKSSKCPKSKKSADKQSKNNSTVVEIFMSRNWLENRETVSKISGHKVKKSAETTEHNWKILRKSERHSKSHCDVHHDGDHEKSEAKLKKTTERKPKKSSVSESTGEIYELKELMILHKKRTALHNKNNIQPDDTSSSYLNRKRKENCTNLPKDSVNKAECTDGHDEICERDAERTQKIVHEIQQKHQDPMRIKFLEMRQKQLNNLLFKKSSTSYFLNYPKLNFPRMTFYAPLKKRTSLGSNMISAFVSFPDNDEDTNPAKKET